MSIQTDACKWNAFFDIIRKKAIEQSSFFFLLKSEVTQYGNLIRQLVSEYKPCHKTSGLRPLV